MARTFKKDKSPKLRSIAQGVLEGGHGAPSIAFLPNPRGCRRFYGRSSINLEPLWVEYIQNWLSWVDHMLDGWCAKLVKLNLG